jgi:hypothetical protein
MRTKTGKGSKLGGIAAILIGLLNVVIIVYFVFATGEQRSDSQVFFVNFAENPLALSIAWIVFSVSAVLSYAVFPAVSDLMEGIHRDWARAATIYGIVGYTVLGVWAITLTRTAPELAANYVSGNEMTRTALLTYGLPEIDPDGWFSFGGIGTWLIIMNVLAICGKRLSKLQAVAGILAGVCAWSTVFGALLDYEPLHLIASAGGAVFFPVWFVWLGVRLIMPSRAIEGSTVHEGSK